ncbi:hypothetical protein, partial [Nitrosomonas eutropha]|uniref:hypothetical protein n=1 Tax=Nitrosomonas eutropha TaxID=916 RepID=UPI003F922FF2
MQRASFRLAVTQSAGRKRSLSAHGRRTPVQTARPPCVPSRPSSRAHPELVLGQAAGFLAMGA